MPTLAPLNRKCLICTDDVELPTKYPYILKPIPAREYTKQNRCSPEHLKDFIRELQYPSDYFKISGLWDKALQPFLLRMFNSFNLGNHNQAPSPLLAALLNEQLNTGSENRDSILLEHNFQLRPYNHEWQVNLQSDLESNSSNAQIHYENPAFIPTRPINDILLFGCGNICHRRCAEKNCHAENGRINKTESLHWLDEMGLTKIYCDCRLCNANHFSQLRFVLLIQPNPTILSKQPAPTKSSTFALYTPPNDPQAAPQPPSFAEALFQNWNKQYYPPKANEVLQRSLREIAKPLKNLLEAFCRAPKINASYVYEQYRLKPAFPALAEEHPNILNFTVQDYCYITHNIPIKLARKDQEQRKNLSIVVFACGCLYPLTTLWEHYRESVIFAPPHIRFSCPHHVKDGDLNPIHTDAVVITYQELLQPPESTASQEQDEISRSAAIAINLLEGLKPQQQYHQTTPAASAPQPQQQYHQTTPAASAPQQSSGAYSRLQPPATGQEEYSVLDSNASYVKATRGVSTGVYDRLDHGSEQSQRAGTPPLVVSGSPGYGFRGVPPDRADYAAPFQQGSAATPTTPRNGSPPLDDAYVSLCDRPTSSSVLYQQPDGNGGPLMRVPSYTAPACILRASAAPPPQVAQGSPGYADPFQFRWTGTITPRYDDIGTVARVPRYDNGYIDINTETDPRPTPIYARPPAFDGNSAAAAAAAPPPLPPRPADTGRSPSTDYVELYEVIDKQFPESKLQGRIRKDNKTVIVVPINGAMQNPIYEAVGAVRIVAGNPTVYKYTTPASVKQGSVPDFPAILYTSRSARHQIFWSTYRRRQLTSGLGIFLLLALGGAAASMLLSKNKSNPSSTTGPGGQSGGLNCSYTGNVRFPELYESLQANNAHLPPLTNSSCVQLEQVVNATLANLQLGNHSDCTEDFVRAQLQAANIIELTSEALETITLAVADVGQYCSPVCFEPFPVINNAFANVTHALGLNASNFPISHNTSGTFVQVGSQTLPLAEALLPNIIAPALVQSAQVHFPCIQNISQLAVLPGLNTTVTRLQLPPQTPDGLSICSAQLFSYANDIQTIQTAIVNNSAVAQICGLTDAPTAAALTAGPTPQPTPRPSARPTPAPSARPTPGPTARPTSGPTAAPTRQPTRLPTLPPSGVPTSLTTTSPTGAPTLAPSTITTFTTLAPTALPTLLPTLAPTTPGPTSPAPTIGFPPTPAERK